VLLAWPISFGGHKCLVGNQATAGLARYAVGKLDWLTKSNAHSRVEVNVRRFLI